MRSLLLLLPVLFGVCWAQAPTDEIRDCDGPQTVSHLKSRHHMPLLSMYKIADQHQGYLDNHNISPSLVLDKDFGILWKNQYDAKERWFARPLLFTPKGKKQIVLLASTANILRILDAADGSLIKERQVQPPFLASDVQYEQPHRDQSLGDHADYCN